MLNLNNLLKDQILWLYNHRCQHSMRYTEHPSCFDKERKSLLNCPVPIEKVGFLDIESTNFKATFGYVICYCIKELDGDIVERVVTPKEVRGGLFDKNVMIQFGKDIIKFDRVIVYWGKDRRFDIPFLRTRAVFWETDFPEYKDMYVTDLYDIVKAKLRLHNNRLQTGCDFLDIESKEHRLKPEIWQKAMAGDKEALDYILEHCREDVCSTEKFWKKLYRFVRTSKTSI